MTRPILIALFCLPLLAACGKKGPLEPAPPPPNKDERPPPADQSHLPQPAPGLAWTISNTNRVS
ncbi:MAG: hypothetical protein AAGF19_08695 [Pseudomonadota bacterium]